MAYLNTGFVAVSNLNGNCKRLISNAMQKKLLGQTWMPQKSRKVDFDIKISVEILYQTLTHCV